MGGPTVIAHGTEEQKARFLAPILSAEEIWCQGFSEPQSGSDLASLKTPRRARRDGGFRVIGPEGVDDAGRTRRSGACSLARTDPDVPKHRGLTYFLLDMEQDGVEVRPLRQITGEAEFNEIFLEDAFVPEENVVGGVGNGWSVAITTLMHERAGLAFAPAGRRPHRPARARRARRASAACSTTRASATASPSCTSRRRCCALNAYRGLTGAMKRGAPGPEGSLGKWHWAEVNQALAELALDVLGPEAQLVDDALDARLPALPGQLDRGRDDGDPQEHRRRARARAAARMNFDLSEDQQDIKRTAREFLAARYPWAEVRRLAVEEERGFTDAQWEEMVELGWPELAELGTVELAGARRGARLRARAHAAPVHLGGGAPARRRGGGGAPGRRPARRRGPVGPGQRAPDAPGAAVLGRPADRRQARGAGRRRGGRAGRVRGGRAPRGGRGGRARAGDRAVRDAGHARAGCPRCASTGRRARSCAATAGRRRGSAITVASAAESVGVAQRAMEMAVAYAKERTQFGRPIGSYQAVSHACAQMLLEVEGARAATYWAAWALDHEPETAPAAASMAKAYAADAGRRVTSAALQVHGGIGFTWEHDLHFLLKRAHANARMYGDAAWHRGRVAALSF